MKYMYKVVLALSLALLVACGSTPSKLPTEVAASSKVNPDEDGIASPITVLIFQLKDQRAFANADFFSIVDAEKDSFDGAVLERQRLQLPPGKKASFDMELNEQARFLAVVGAYRDLSSASWIEIKPIPAKPKKYNMKVVMAKNRVLLNLKKD